MVMPTAVVPVARMGVRMVVADAVLGITLAAAAIVAGGIALVLVVVPVVVVVAAPPRIQSDTPMQSTTSHPIVAPHHRHLAAVFSR